MSSIANARHAAAKHSLVVDVGKIGNQSGSVEMEPSIGRIVHYYPELCDPEGCGICLECGIPRAALIVLLGWPDAFDVNLVVFDSSGGTSFRESVPFADRPTSGHWNWPRYVTEKDK